MKKADVLVTGAETHQGVVVIRSLGSRGIRMVVTGDKHDSKGFYSRYSTYRELSPPSSSQKDAFVGKVLELVKKYDVQYVYPVTESSLLALDDHRGEIDARARLIAPSSKLIREGIDKKRTFEFVRDLGISTSKTFYPETMDEALNAASEWGFPIVLKPRGGSTDIGVGGRFDFKALFVKDLKQLREILASFKVGQFPIMQDYAYGPQTCFTCFVENGEDIHSNFQDDMVRMLPMWGGVGARRLSREIDPEILRQSHLLFRAMKWEGCAQTQWKGPGKDGRYKFLEVTVRLMASVGSPVFSGVDLPWMQFQYFTGQKVDRINSFEIGKHSRWFRGDTVTVARHLLGDMPASGDPLPPRYQMFCDWVYDFIRPGLRNDVESVADPFPAIVEFKLLVLDIVKVIHRRVGEMFPSLRKSVQFVKAISVQLFNR